VIDFHYVAFSAMQQTIIMAARSKARMRVTVPETTRPVRLQNYLAYGSNDVLGAGSMAVISGWVLIF
jgi:hypothetical protein